MVSSSYKSLYGYSSTKDDSGVGSVFSSVGVKTALGKGLLGWADVNLMVSSVVKRKEDAERLFDGGERAKKSVLEEVEVCECLTDRKGNRAGRWGCFEMIDGQLRTALS